MSSLDAIDSVAAAAPNNNSRSTKHRLLMERILASSSVYLLCQIVCYDQELHRSLSATIRQIELIEADIEAITTSDQLLAKLIDRHIELLNLRMMMLRLKHNHGAGGGNDSGMDTVSDEDSALGGEDFKVMRSMHDIHRQPDLIQKSTSSSKEHLLDGSPSQGDSLPKTFSSTSGFIKLCHYCNGEHLSEFCPLTVREKSDILRKHRLCAECLDKFDNSWWPSLNTPPVHRRPPINEPLLLETADLLTIPQPIIHPESSFVSLIHVANKDRIAFTPTVSVRGNSDTCSALARAIINRNCEISLVSPQLLAKLHISPTKIPPFTVSQLTGEPFTIYSYAVVEISSLYRPYRYRRIFYVADCTFYRIQPVTPEVRKLVRANRIPLSNDLYYRGALHLDLVIGADQLAMTGYELTEERRIILSKLEHFKVAAYYTHFGYLLFGCQKVNHDSSNGVQAEESN